MPPLRCSYPFADEIIRGRDPPAAPPALAAGVAFSPEGNVAPNNRRLPAASVPASGETKNFLRLQFSMVVLVSGLCAKFTRAKLTSAHGASQAEKLRTLIFSDRD